MNQEAQELMSKYPIVIVDVMTEWCRPCKLMAHVLDAVIQKEMEHGDVALIAADGDDKDTATEFRVDSVPTVIFFVNQQEVCRLKGVQTVEVLHEHIKKCRILVQQGLTSQE
jgi:thioredoxin-like negative regulator of GroEL